MLTRDQIQQHIDELDAQIPKEDAELLIWYEGDSPDCEIIGNYVGYLRFGIEDAEGGCSGTRARDSRHNYFDQLYGSDEMVSACQANYSARRC